MSQAPIPGGPSLGRADPLELNRVSLFLDLDGTLAPIVARPEDVRPVPARTALLEALATRLEGRLAVVSGRAIADVDRILGGAVRAVAGVHGLERRDPDGALRVTPTHPALAAVRAELNTFAQGHPGVRIEDKTLSLAIHFRAAPQSAAEARTLARGIADAHGLTLQAGDMVLELRTPGPDKGDAVAAFMAAAPFAGRLPVFVGDDLTDEAGFAAAAGLGGHGVLVGPVRATQASQRLADSAAVLTWLEQSLTTENAA